MPNQKVILEALWQLYITAIGEGTEEQSENMRITYETVKEYITRASHPREDVDALPDGLQDDVCFIVSKYGVRDIYNATEEILHAVSRGIKIKAGGNDAR